MRSPVRFPIAALVLSLIAFTRFAFAVPGTTAFTYQGHLDSSGLPANADFDFRFSLFDAKTAGNAIGTPVEQKNVTVSNGLFTCEITFPIIAFDTGADRWIALEVKPAGSGAYVVLDPRQHVTRQPYATSALGLSEVLPISRGGTGSATQRFVDLTTAQTVGEKKTFLKGGVTVTILDSTMGLFSQTTSTGQAGHFKIANAANTSAALEGESNGTGPAVKGTATGTGLAGEFVGSISVSGGVKFPDNTTLTSASSLVPKNFMIAGTATKPPTGFTLAGTINGNDEKWIRKSNMPAVSYNLATVSLNGKLYAIGGTDGTGKSFDTFYEYDPATDVWNSKPTLLAPRSGAAAVVLNGKIYLIGGVDSTSAPLDTLYVYDPATNLWTTKAPLPGPQAYQAAVVFNGKIYSIGGIDATKKSVDNLYVYDSVNNSWSAETPLPAPRSLPTAAVIDGKIYVPGGTDFSNIPVDTLYVYDPTAKTWSVDAPLPAPRGALGGTVLNGLFYAVGGAINDSTPTDSLFEYNPATRIWESRARLPIERAISGVATLNGKIYVVGGGGIGVKPTDTLYEYTPPVTYFLYKKN